jgi:hypothetical protein
LFKQFLDRSQDGFSDSVLTDAATIAVPCVILTNAIIDNLCSIFAAFTAIATPTTTPGKASEQERWVRPTAGVRSVILHSYLHFLERVFVYQSLKAPINLKYFSESFGLGLDLNLGSSVKAVAVNARVGGILEQMVDSRPSPRAVRRTAGAVDVISQVCQRIAPSGIPLEHLCNDWGILVRL